MKSRVRRDTPYSPQKRRKKQPTSSAIRYSSARPTSLEDRVCRSIQVKQHQVLAKGEKVTLTLKEFELLKFLMENKGIVLTRDRLLGHVWGYDFDGETRTVDVHVRTLRQKLGECGELIETVRGVGYRIGG